MYFSDTCRHYLLRYLNDTAFENAPADKHLWLNVDGGDLSYYTVGRILTEISKSTGVKISPHRFRHTCVTMLVACGTDVFAVQNLLGHSKVTTTQIYVSHNSENLKKVQNSNSPLSQIGVGGKNRGRPRKQW
jgi:integrase/recombinase XerC